MSHKSKLELSERGDADTAIYNIQYTYARCLFSCIWRVYNLFLIISFLDIYFTYLFCCANSLLALASCQLAAVGEADAALIDVSHS